MSVPDIVNGIFEASGAGFQMLSVRAVLRDRQVRGVAWPPTLFFSAWGVWNLFYYTNLHQPVSFVGGMAIIGVNSIWLALAFRFRRSA